MKAANLYEKEFTKIIQKLSMHECSKELKKKVGDSQEPYRTYLRPIRNKLKTTQKEIEMYLNEKKSLKNSLLVQSATEIINPLKVVYNSLCEVKCKAIANGSVLDLIRRAYSFGLNLARLDIRQESKRHLKLMKSICKHLGLGNFEEWSEEEKISFLSREFKSKRPLISKNISLDKKEIFSSSDHFSKSPRPKCLQILFINFKCFLDS